MRTVIEIVGAVQDQQPATEEELRMALLCLYYHGSLHTQPDYKDASLLQLRMRASGAFESRFRMLKADPRTYLGTRWTPGTAENDHGRRVSEAIARKAGVL